MNGKIVKEGITFDDVLLIPAKSDVLPNEVSLKTRPVSYTHLSISTCINGIY